MLLTSLILASTTVTSTFARAFAVPDPAAVNAAINPSGILDFEPVESVLLNTSIPLEAIDAEYRKRNVERDVYGNQLKRDLAAMEAAHEKVSLFSAVF